MPGNIFSNASWSKAKKTLCCKAGVYYILSIHGHLNRYKAPVHPACHSQREKRGNSEACLMRKQLQKVRVLTEPAAPSTDVLWRGRGCTRKKRGRGSGAQQTRCRTPRTGRNPCLRARERWLSAPVCEGASANESPISRKTSGQGCFFKESAKNSTVTLVVKKLRQNVF